MRSLLVMLSLLGLAACDGGVAPVITSIAALDPASVPVRTKSDVTLRVVVNDEDGDLRALRLTLRSPSNTDNRETRVDVRDQAGDARNSTITLLIEVGPTEVGTHTLEVMAVDSEDNEGAPVSTPLEVTES